MEASFPQRSTTPFPGFSGRILCISVAGFIVGHFLPVECEWEGFGAKKKNTVHTRAREEQTSRSCLSSLVAPPSKEKKDKNSPIPARSASRLADWLIQSCLRVAYQSVILFMFTLVEAGQQKKREVAPPPRGQIYYSRHAVHTVNVCVHGQPG